MKKKLPCRTAVTALSTEHKEPILHANPTSIIALQLDSVIHVRNEQITNMYKLQSNVNTYNTPF